MTERPSLERIRLGVSACLLGQPVRYDGQHKHDRFITDTLGKYVEYVPVCPEVECGLPVPREAMRLVGDPAAPRLMTVRTRQDLTDQMLGWARMRVLELEKEDLCGFIFKSDSPSSGMDRVKVYNEKGAPAGRAPGMFAREFMRHFPLLPVEEEGRLHDPDLRENFIERIFALQRYRGAIGADRSLATLMRFHERHKYLIQSHSPSLGRRMGALLGAAKRRNLDSVCEEYEGLLLTALKSLATPGKHANILLHMLGYLKEHLTADEKQEMLLLIDQMRGSIIPLVVPVTMLSHYVRKYRIEYLFGQYYLDPHPIELKLRNHA
jgi:uncharacterized protein YbgA (DUF1722 family)/uncharacterized protein YbbK (DUF523 family)